MQVEQQVAAKDTVRETDFHKYMWENSGKLLILMGWLQGREGTQSDFSLTSQ